MISKKTRGKKDLPRVFCSEMTDYIKWHICAKLKKIIDKSKLVIAFVSKMVYDNSN